MRFGASRTTCRRASRRRCSRRTSRWRAVRWFSSTSGTSSRATRVPRSPIRSSGAGNGTSANVRGVAISVPHVAGREVELDALLDLFEATDELPATAVIVGEAGIGKTTLWLAAVEAAQARGYLVLSSRPADAEAAFSFVG